MIFYVVNGGIGVPYVTYRFWSGGHLQILVSIIVWNMYDKKGYVCMDTNSNT